MYTFFTHAFCVHKYHVELCSALKCFAESPIQPLTVDYCSYFSVVDDPEICYITHKNDIKERGCAKISKILSKSKYRFREINFEFQLFSQERRKWTFRERFAIMHNFHWWRRFSSLCLQIRFVQLLRRKKH